MELLLALGNVWFGAEQADAPGSYLERVARTVEVCQTDLPAMVPVAEEAARRLAAGGAFWAAGQASMVSELSGRAGGFMMLRSLGDAVPASGDVILHFPEPGGSLPNSRWENRPLVITVGAASPAPAFSNHADRYGISPTLANAIPGWLFTGELITALTRLGKMPVIYESIGAYGGNARIAQYQNGGIAFHNDLAVPLAPPEAIGKRFVEIITAMLRRVEREERGSLDRAGAWAREAHVQGKQLFMYSMGHLFPDEVGKTAIGARFTSAVWNAGFRAHPAPQDAYVEGDLAVLIGYQHPADLLLRRARPAGARVVYVSVRPDRDFMNDPGAIWIDPMWDWPDACVPLDGYDVPLLAASGIVNGAIAWEIYRLSAIE
jgi:hypothetical protein